MFVSVTRQVAMQGLSPELTAAIKLQRSGKVKEAEQVYRQLLNHVSQALQAHSALGVLLSSQGRLAEARGHYQKVLEQEPGDLVARKLLADTYSEEGDVESSAEHYRELAESQPEAWLWKLRADIASPTAFTSNAAIDEYRLQLQDRLTAYQQSPHGIDLDELAGSACKPPLSLAYHGRDDRPLKEQFAAIFAERLPAELPRCGTGKPHVGFVVTEGNEGVFLRGMAGVLDRLDSRQLRVSVICSPRAEGKFKAAVRRDLEYVFTASRFSTTIENVRNAGCDLLYFWEIGTDCTNYFLPFFRLAPVQCTSWGWPVTSGIADVDYFLSSELLDPPGAEQHYTEKIVRLKHLPNYYPLPRYQVDADRVRLGIGDKEHIYFCGQNPRKLHPDFDELMGRILRSDAQGVVALVQAAKPFITAALQARFERTLPDCANRIRWVPRMTQGEYLSWMAAADCVLDTPHYCGGANSTYDAFAVDAPVVTLTGAFHRGRYTTAAYRTMGIEDCIAASADGYSEIAVRLATDSDFRRSMQQKIRERRSALFDNAHAVGELERFFCEAIASTR